MKTVLICHHDAPLDHDGLARWMASFSDLSGIVLLRETRQRVEQRIQREVKRVGRVRFADVLAFRLYYRAFLSAKDQRWQEDKLAELRARYPDVSGVPVLETADPNSAEVERFLREAAPDIVVARCKSILKEAIFSIPESGTYVMHPGICPEYRNAHGCFWALANGDRDKVGMTLLRIDKGVDTGPVYGYFRYPYDPASESHVVIQHRVVLDNLDAIREKLVLAASGRATPIETEGRPSATWGQPWLTSYLRWRTQAKRASA
jgi:folate-dependent phosphoribosylglycinamide formyltransferase PurN